MQFKHTLVLSLTAVFAVFSCITVDKTVGDEFLPSNQDIPVKVAQINIPIGLKLADSLQGLSQDYALVGSITTKELGTANFSTVADICPLATGGRYGDDRVVKYIFFTAAVKGNIVMEDNQAGIPQNISIYRTNRSIDSTTIYSNSFKREYYSQNPISLSQTTYFGGDSIKVFLDNSLAEELLSATDNELDTLSTFMKSHKGIYIKCDDNNNGLSGGRLNKISFASACIYIKYNFQPKWAAGLSRKDTLVTLGFGHSYCLNLSTYQSKDLQTMEPLETLPIEGLAGIKPYISYIDLKDTIDNWKKRMGYEGKNIAIAKATFSLPFEIPDNFDMTKYPQTIFPTHKNYDTDSLTNYYYPFNDINSTGNGLGTINRSLCEYSGDISTTIQNFIKLDKSQLDDSYNMWIFPIYSVTDSYSGTTTYNADANQNYYVGKINGPAATRKPVLKLVYSVIE